MSRVTRRTALRARTIKAGKMRAIFLVSASDNPFMASAGDMRAIARPANDTDDTALLEDETGQLWRAYILRPAYRRK